MIPLFGLEIVEGDDPLTAAMINNNNNSEIIKASSSSSSKTSSPGNNDNWEAVMNFDDNKKRGFAISQKESQSFPIKRAIYNNSNNNGDNISPLSYSLNTASLSNDGLSKRNSLTNDNDIYKNNSLISGAAVSIINNNNSLDQSENQNNKITLSNGESIFTLFGETILLKLPNVELILISKNSLKGVLVVTNYRIHFSPDPEEIANAEWLFNDLDFFSVSLGLISKVSRPQGVAALGRGRELAIYCKDIHQFQFKFDDWVLAERTDSLIKNSAFPISISSNTNNENGEERSPESGVKWLFAFSHFSSHYQSNIKHGKDLLMIEWNRQELFNTNTTTADSFNNNEINDLEKNRKGHFIPKFKIEGKEINQTSPIWRICNINENFTFCETYPSHFVVPSVITNNDLYEVAEFRSKNRIPVLCWRNPRNGASIWRCSQPKVGIGFASSQDERLVESIRQQTPKGQMLIIDCRPYRNAVANRAKGMGYEDESRYRNTSLIFENIENIHAVRNSYRSLVKFLLNEGSSSTNNFLASIEQSGWLNHIRSLITAALKLTGVVGVRGLGTIVHCSDGWDRAPQLVSLAQLLLDPYYRTIDGLRVLIEKEWILFGHQFRERNCLGSDNNESEEYSPIFLQFLDCIWQFLNQFPTAFQFSEDLLLFLAEHQYSCRFGDFLCNSHYQRVHEKIEETTRSIWDYIFENSKQFINPLYIKRENEDILLPNRDPVLKQVTLWNSYFLRESYNTIKSRKNQANLKISVIDNASKEIQQIMAYSLSKIEELENRVKSLQATLIDKLNSNFSKDSEDIADNDNIRHQ